MTEDLRAVAEGLASIEGRVMCSHQPPHEYIPCAGPSCWRLGHNSAKPGCHREVQPELSGWEYCDGKPISNRVSAILARLQEDEERLADRDAVVAHVKAQRDAAEAKAEDRERSRLKTLGLLQEAEARIRELQKRLDLLA